ncbi:hypothetical protein [Eel River basin pequenovirus]|nr:hypothetical protein [Eel River basin pequenovirus]
MNYIPGRGKSVNPFPSQTVPNMVDDLATIFDRIMHGRHTSTGLDPVYVNNPDLPEEFYPDPKLDKVESFVKARKMAQMIDDHDDRVRILQEQQAAQEKDSMMKENESLKAQLAELTASNQVPKKE